MEVSPLKVLERFIVVGSDDHCFDLLNRAWQIIPDDYQVRIKQSQYLHVIRFTAVPWKGKSDADAGVHFDEQGVMCFDKKFISVLPDDVALVLITHEFAHVYLCTDNVDHDEAAARLLNHVWHVKHKFPKRRTRVHFREKGVGENLLDEWSIANGYATS